MHTLLQISDLDIPIALIEKPSNYNVILGSILFIAFCMVSFARMSKPLLFKNLFVSWTKTQNLSAYIKESMPLNKSGSLLLMLNYFISGSVLLFLKLQEFNLEFAHLLLLSLLTPIVLFVLGLLGFMITGAITGEARVLREPLYMRIIGAEISGILFFIASVVWMLNVDMVQIVWQTTIFLFCAEYLIRILKSISVVYTNGVSWFYIILYLCTLEILPLFVVYYLVVRSFGLF